MDPSAPTIVFIARASTADGGAELTRNRLMESLTRYTRPAYEDKYGRLAEHPEFRVFWQGSNVKLSLSVSEPLKDHLRRARESSRPAIFAINGWDGLTTNSFSFVNLFKEFEDVDVKIRVFDIADREFFEVDVKVAVSLFAGDLDPEDNELDAGANEFFANVQAINAFKGMLSVSMKELRTKSSFRNTPPEKRGSIRRVSPCGLCGEEFSSFKAKTSHIRRWHKDQDSNDLVCPHCLKIFTLKDGRDHHVSNAVCEENPAYEKPQPQPKRARGTGPLRAVGRQIASGGRSNLYQGLTDGTQLPRLDAALVRSDIQLGQMCPVIPYRGEVFCRWPDCNKRERFQNPTKLRVHYKGQHGFEYQQFQTGPINTAYQAAHLDGLEWLARRAMLAPNDVPAPVPERW